MFGLNLNNLGNLNPQTMMNNAVQGATQAGGNFLQDLISSPFRAMAGMGQGALNGVLRFGLWGSAATMAALAFAPDLVKGVFQAVGLDGVNQHLAQTAASGGLPAIAMTALAVGGGAGAAIGGVTGLLSGIGGGRGASQSAPGLGTVIGGGVALAAVTAVAIGAVKINGVKLADDKPGDPTPDPTPGRTTPAEVARRS